MNSCTSKDPQQQCASLHAVCVSAGIATMPPWLKLLLAPVQGLTSVTVKPLSLFYKLLATVLAPALIGKVGGAQPLCASV